MVLDSSAVLAILQGEPEAGAFALSIERAERVLISAVSVLEVGIVIESRRGAEGAGDLDAFLREGLVEVAAFDADQTALARQAFRRYGKGRHPAALNFGDCAAYALAKVSGEPLLFKGNDFSHTDVARADSPADT
jgi:ribonuclease VapC